MAHSSRTIAPAATFCSSPSAIPFSPSPRSCAARASRAHFSASPASAAHIFASIACVAASTLSFALRRNMSTTLLFNNSSTFSSHRLPIAPILSTIFRRASFGPNASSSTPRTCVPHASSNLISHSFFFFPIRSPNTSHGAPALSFSIFPQNFSNSASISARVESTRLLYNCSSFPSNTPSMSSSFAFATPSSYRSAPFLYIATARSRTSPSTAPKSRPSNTSSCCSPSPPPYRNARALFAFTASSALEASASASWLNASHRTDATMSFCAGRSRSLLERIVRHTLSAKIANPSDVTPRLYLRSNTAPF
mmetsp:Transcript_1200/g.2417  ORF Transcript_1200/g.2417 Transcript_1200/m.2417 type:complete len:309 (+) Transcript_1200:789-1715(+)